MPRFDLIGWFRRPDSVVGGSRGKPIYSIDTSGPAKILAAPKTWEQTIPVSGDRPITLHDAPPVATANYVEVPGPWPGQTVQWWTGVPDAKQPRTPENAYDTYPVRYENPPGWGGGDPYSGGPIINPDPPPGYRS